LATPQVISLILMCSSATHRVVEGTDGGALKVHSGGVHR
jgi:hypothetical protein